MHFPDPLGWAVLIGGALIGSTLGGVAGFGAGIIMLPLLAWTVGIRASVPVLTVTMFLGNLSRVYLSRGEVDRRVVGRFLAGAVPATVLGAVIYAGAASASLRWVIGVFMIAAVPLRRLLLSRNVTVRLRHFPVLGVGIGILSSLVVGTGPVLAPFFLAYGLRRGAFIATEGVCTMGMHIARGAIFAAFALITWRTLALGLVLGGIMFVGAWLSRRLMDRMTDRVFLGLIETLLVVMGLQFLLISR